MANIKLDAKKRDAIGKNKTNKIRNEKLIPAAVFMKGEETLPITISARDFDLVYKEAGFTSIIDLNIEGKNQRVITKEVDRHPFKNQILHVNFMGINMNEKVKIEVPIEFENKDMIKEQPSVFMQILNTVTVECFPADLPEVAKVNVEDMKIEDTLCVKDLDIAKDGKIEILNDLEETICVLTHEKPEVEESEEEVDPAEVPIVGHKDEE